MATVTTINGDMTVTGNLQVNGSRLPLLARSSLQQDANSIYPINLTDFRVWDAVQTNLPGTAAADDLALITGTFATSSCTIRTSDAKATTVTQRARAFVRIPAEYDAAETVSIKISAGMITTVSDSTATVDVEAYEVNRTGGLGGSPTDLCATAAQSINSLTFAEKTFTITSSGLVAGDVLDVRITIAITDGATGTAVIGAIGAIDLLADVKG